MKLLAGVRKRLTSAVDFEGAYFAICFGAMVFAATLDSVHRLDACGGVLVFLARCVVYEST